MHQNGWNHSMHQVNVKSKETNEMLESLEETKKEQENIIMLSECTLDNEVSLLVCL